MDIPLQCAGPMYEGSNDPHNWEKLGPNHEQCDSAITENSIVELESKPPGHTHTEIVQSTPKMISAMKGGRKQNGLYLEKLTVTWAPDVYDPPVTSQSHTVKSCSQQCSRSGRKSSRSRHKHKHKNTTKSSKGNSTNKKQCRKTVKSYHMLPELPIACCEVLEGGLSHPSGLDNFAVSKQDSKCGSSLFGSSLTDFQMSFAEAA